MLSEFSAVSSDLDISETLYRKLRNGIISNLVFIHQNLMGSLCEDVLQERIA